MRTLVKKLRGWCDNWLARDEIKSQYIGVMNEMNANRGAILTAIDAVVPTIVKDVTATLGERIENEVSEQFKVAGPLIVQKVVELLSGRISDSNVVIRDILVDRNDDLKESLFRREALLDNSIGGVAKHLTAFQSQVVECFDRVSEHSMRGNGEIRRQIEESIFDAQTVINQGLDELGRHTSIHDANNADRMLTMLDRFRHIEAQMKLRSELTDGKLSVVFSGMNELEKAVANLAEVVLRQTPTQKPRHNTAPALNWLIDNMPKIIAAAEVMSDIRDGKLERGDAIFKGVRALKALELYSTFDVRDELETWIAACEKARAPVFGQVLQAA